MNKDDLPLLFVRAFGVYFVLKLAFALVTIAMALVIVAKFHFFSAADISDADTFLASAQWTRVYSWSIDAVISAAFAYYCFCRGAMLHRLLTSGLPLLKTK